MIAAIALALLPLPDLAELDRFPPLTITNAQIGFLIEQRAFIRGQLALDPRNGDRWRRLLIGNDHSLRCWETLLEAHGALGEEEGGRDDEEYCRSALARLRALLGEGCVVSANRRFDRSSKVHIERSCSQ